MPWLRVDDTALTHPKAMRLRTMEDDVVSAERVIGWVMLSATWSGQHLTDCWIPESVGAVASPHAWNRLAAAALKVKLLSRARRDGQAGWLVVINDGLFHLMSKEEVERNREKRRATRIDAQRIEVLLRDTDRCRYCGVCVNPKDRKSARGREFDHPDPADRSTYVVSCQGCNGHKHERTPEQAGMTLLPPPTPDEWHFHPTTLLWLADRGIDPYQRPDAPQAPDTATRARPSNQLDTDATTREPTRATAATQREPHQATAAHQRDTAPATAATSMPSTDQHQHHHQDQTSDPPAAGTGRVGPGRSGSVPAGAPAGAPSRSRDGPPTRGRRGRRGRQPRAP